MLSDRSFDAVCDLFHRVSGIRLTPAKRALVEGRLQRLAGARGAASLDAYVREVMQRDDREALSQLVDKLTTNETYFFREPEHFDHVAGWLDTRPPGRPLRVWSAAASSGEEAYSLAMLLADRRGLEGWEIVGTDLSGAMVEAARTALYPTERAREMPRDYLRRFCLKGTGPYAGQLLVERALRERVRFLQANLTQPLPDLGRFDLIFLRNVLIYFDAPAKAAIVRRVIERLAPDGLLYTGHAESLANLGLPLRAVAGAVYVHGAS